MKNESANLADFQDMPYDGNRPLNEKPDFDWDAYEERVRAPANKMMEAIGDLGHISRGDIIRFVLFVLDHYPYDDDPLHYQEYLVHVKHTDLR